MTDTTQWLPLEIFYKWEQEQADQVWLSQPLGNDQWLDYTWRNAAEQIRRVANGLLDLGLKPGDRVGLYGSNSARWVMADMAIMMAGGVSVPIYTSMPKDKVRYVAGHSGMSMIFADDSCALNLESIPSTLDDSVCLIALNDDGHDRSWSQLLLDYDPIDNSPVRTADDLWSIIYTSGTTGMPKGVMHTFASMAFNATQTLELAGTDQNTSFFSYLPLAHGAERFVVELHALFVGGHIYFNGSRERFTSDLQHARPTFFLAVPRIWHNLKAGIIKQLGEDAWLKLLQNPETARQVGAKILGSMGLDRVRYAVSGSAPIAPTDIEAWMALGMPIFESFGQSENITATTNRPNDYKIGSIGKPFSERVECRITEAGELLLRSAGNMLGYYNEPEKTAETIVDGWLHTGDKVRVDEEGFIFITGRVKDIFKTAKGKYVAPAPIENRFADLSFLEQLSLVGRGMPQTILLVVLSDMARSRPRKEIQRELSAKLEDVNLQLEMHERISHIIICRDAWTIQNEMLTHTLKVKRDDVEQKLRATIDQCLSGTDSAIVWE